MPSGGWNKRNDGAALGVASERFPGGEIVDEDREEADAADDPLAVVEQPIPQQRFRARRVDRGRRQRGHDGQPFARREPPSGRDRERAVAADVAAPIGAARADAAGEGGPAQRRGAVDEMQMISRRFDREAPEIAGDVPVQFGLGVEETHLPAGAILEHVGVFAGLDPRVFVTGIDAEDAVGALGVIGLDDGRRAGRQSC